MSTSNVIEYPQCEFTKDYNEFVVMAEKSEPWSEDRRHALALLAVMIKSENIPKKIKEQAVIAITRYSDTAQTCDEYLGASITKEVRNAIGYGT